MPHQIIIEIEETIEIRKPRPEAPAPVLVVEKDTPELVVERKFNYDNGL
jgi:hypothetical protein